MRRYCLKHKNVLSVHYLHFRTIVLIFVTMFITHVSAVERSGLLQVAGMSNLHLYFAHRGRLFLFHEPCLMDWQLSVISCNFPSENSPLTSPGIELTLFWVCRHMAQWINALVDTVTYSKECEFNTQ